VLAATDPNTDVGTVIEEGKFGYWCESNNAESFVSLMNKFSDESRRREMGENAYQFLINHYDAARTYKIIFPHVS